MRSGFKLGTFLSLCVAAAMASCGSDEPAASTCGNSVVETGEACDGANVNNATCASVGMGTATTPLSCNADCTYNFAACGGGGGAGGMMP
jgi:hypothetical protein